ncbi:uncharacterized protein LOC131604951 [Vicia villosa]|uniref:uncharacterized protein LOC131604951 n=1 Tax=Vicia villosa TaxID=3911 RepID=UPI00273BDD99|nr:uncharacterized protein LOC131604951 [Vicia villosa]
MDFCDLNVATPKDEYSMPVAGMLIDSAAGFEYLSMLDGYSGYNQIFIVEEDVSENAFRCPRAIGTYEWHVDVYVSSHFDVIKHMLSKPIVHNMIGKWALALTEYSLAFLPLKAMKGQVVSDFIVDHAVIEKPSVLCGIETLEVILRWFDP